MPERKPVVLILDEDPLALELYTRELESEFQVLACASVQEARQGLARETVAVLVIEPATGEDDGWALIREINSRRNPPPLILCSVEDDRRSGLVQGARVFLVKPVLPATLHGIVQKVLATQIVQSSQRLEIDS